jgi:riboflavin synthase
MEEGRRGFSFSWGLLMFTGIIEGKARVVRLKEIKQGARLTLQVPAAFAGLRSGSSVAVNGVCLTVSGRGAGKLSFDLLSETMKCTTFGCLRTDAPLNLERALRWGKRLEGHFVQGHVDGLGRVIKIFTQSMEKSFQISFPHRLKRYFLEKGSVAVNGVSLTIGRVRPGSFWVHVIPTTLKKTNLGQMKAGDSVNLETDVLLKSRLTRV